MQLGFFHCSRCSFLVFFLILKESGRIPHLFGREANRSQLYVLLRQNGVFGPRKPRSRRLSSRQFLGARAAFPSLTPAKSAFSGCQSLDLVGVELLLRARPGGFEPAASFRVDVEESARASFMLFLGQAVASSGLW